MLKENILWFDSFLWQLSTVNWHRELQKVSCNNELEVKKFKLLLKEPSQLKGRTCSKHTDSESAFIYNLVKFVALGQASRQSTVTTFSSIRLENDYTFSSCCFILNSPRRDKLSPDSLQINWDFSPHFPRNSQFWKVGTWVTFRDPETSQSYLQSVCCTEPNFRNLAGSNHEDTII